MTELPQPKREGFSQQMTDILSYDALNLAMAVGYRTGLFEAMASSSSPQPTAAIAARAGLHQRYVREWLGIMFTGKVVELFQGEDEQECYLLLPEHAALLTRGVGNANLTAYTQEIPLLTNCATEQVIPAFRSGAGVGLGMRWDKNRLSPCCSKQDSLGWKTRGCLKTRSICTAAVTNENSRNQTGRSSNYDSPGLKH